MGDPRAHRRKSDTFEPAVARDVQSVRGRTTQSFSRSLPSQLHARRVNHKSCAELTARSDRRAANRNRADFVAFTLNLIAALSADRARHTAAKLQVIVRGVDDDICVTFGEIADAETDLVVRSCHLLLHTSRARLRCWTGYDFASDF